MNPSNPPEANQTIVKEELIKIKVGEKECFAKLIFCSKEDCKDFAETKLTQDNKFYCEKHGAEELANWFCINYGPIIN